MKKIILFENIDKLNFYFSLILIPFFKKIYFREASYGQNHYFFKKNLNKIFFQVGLKDLSGELVNKSFNLKKYLIKKYVNKNFKSEIFDAFCKLVNIKNEDKKNLIYSIENNIYLSKYEAIDTSSYICIKLFFPDCISYYVPNSETTFLVMKQIKNKKLRIIGFTVFFNMFFLNVQKFLIIFLKKLNFFVKKKNNNKSNDGSQKKDNATIGYFPHGGIRYDFFFKKNFFYQKSISSQLYSDNIETFTFQKFDDLSLRYFRFCKLKNTELNKLPNNINYKQIIKFTLFFYNNKKFILKNRLINFRIFCQLYLSIEKYNNFFKNKNYNYLFFYNDTLISSGLLLSAGINQIKTISFQDRLTSYNYYYRCFFDLYLVAGKKFEKIFKNKYFIKKYEVLGLTRANLISKKNNPLIENILKKDFKIITCLLLAPNLDWKLNIHGEDGTSYNSTIRFCKEIVELSKIFTNRYFVIKFKILHEVNDAELIADINKIILSSSNVLLHSNNDILSTNFIAHSELVIGKYSTILDEALISGKNVLFHDDEKFISSLGFFKKNRFLIVQNFDELLSKTRDILEKKSNFYRSYTEQKSHYINDYITNDGNVGNQKKIVEIIEKYIIN